MSGARLGVGTGIANVATGLPVLDHLLTELARAGRFDLVLEIEPDDPETEVSSAGVALGQRTPAASCRRRPRSCHRSCR